MLTRADERSSARAPSLARQSRAYAAKHGMSGRRVDSVPLDTLEAADILVGRVRRAHTASPCLQADPMEMAPVRGSNSFRFAPQRIRCDHRREIAFHDSVPHPVGALPYEPVGRRIVMK